MSIETVCEAIREIGQDISGIKMAFDPPPAKLDTASLPALYVLTGPATHDWLRAGSDGDYETREYRVQVAVLPLGQATPQASEERARPLVTAVRDAFVARPGLGPLEDVLQMTVLGDSGVVRLPDYGEQFIGFEMRLRVVEAIERIYGDEE